MISACPLHIHISIDDQKVELWQGDALLKCYPISSASKGVGFMQGSFRTPTGNFHICEKHGDGQDIGTIFRARIPAGKWMGEDIATDLILTRILWLAGNDEENLNTKERYIYIHGTNCEQEIGLPVSCGCIRLKNEDVVELYDMVSVGTEVRISPPLNQREKLIFLDCDSTLSFIEGIDELARFCGEDIYQQVVALTDAAMNGQVPLDQVFGRRMDIIRPNRAACDAVAQQYIDSITPGALGFVDFFKSIGWRPVILSGGFSPLIKPLAAVLGIEFVEAVPLYLDNTGKYAGYDKNYPTTRNFGKNYIIREWKAAISPRHTIMIGDGISDLETMPDVDLFLGYGGVTDRPLVKEKSRHWVTDMTNLDLVAGILRSENLL